MSAYYLYRKFSPCFLLLVLLFISIRPLPAQRTSEYTTFYPIAEHAYDIKSGLPDLYLTDIVVDESGRMTILKTGTGRTAFPSFIYHYDGIKASPANLQTIGEISRLFGKTLPSGSLYGYYFYQHDHRLRSAFFTYDPVHSRTTSINFIESIGEEGIIKSVSYAEGSYFTLAFNERTLQYQILQVQDDRISSLLRFRADSLPQSGNAQLGVQEDYFWVSNLSNGMYRIDRKTGTVERFSLAQASVGNFHPMVVAPRKELWLSNDREIYRWDSQSEQFRQNPHLPEGWSTAEITRATLYKDHQDNLLLRYAKGSTEKATLIDTDGELFDYTPVLSAHHGIAGANFKQTLIFYDPGIRFVDVSARSGIQNIHSLQGTRGMVEISAQKLHIFHNTESSLFAETDRAWHPVSGAPPCMEEAFADSDLAKDKAGNIWFTARRSASIRQLIRYDPVSQQCTSFNFGLRFDRFDFLDSNQVVCATADSLYTLNPNTRKLTPVCQFPSPLTLNQVFVGENDLIWLASDEGLLRVDLKTKETRRINLVGNTHATVLHIHQDKRGRLWLGTAAEGLVVYDPSRESILVINQAVGLSNNTVVSLLEDHEGDIWAGTFCGITLISPELEVLGKLYEEDGLVNNECNRWSSLKLEDGRLCFGSVTGCTIIDPVRWKAPLKDYAVPRIYLTDLYSKTSSEGPPAQNDLLHAYQAKRRIVLPADNRNLEIGFSLSNYAAPEKATFAYQLQGKDEQWNYVGDRRKLSLAALPAGSYNILIKGSAGRGKWSDPPIVISLRVKKFFYQQWWFFVLCTLPFLAFLLLWLLRQRGERKRLEAEVRRRTYTIQEQADRLQELDKAKSILYTNITHEFRTPLTVISGMASLIDKNPETARDLISRNSDGLLRLVNQILDLAKIESGHLRLSFIQADIIPFIFYLTQSLQSFAEHKNLQLTVQAEMDELIMDFDQEKISIIISNLLSNAIKFSDGDSRHIYLTAAMVNEQLEIKVKDEGIGIPAHMLPHVFDRFYQAEDANYNRNANKHTGSGIGLTLTKELVELMGGNIRVESKVMEGTECTVSLPISRKAPIRSPKLSDKKPAEIPATIGTSQELQTDIDDSLPLLLLIEDHRDVAIYIQTCLQGKYQISWVPNGARGIEQAFTTIPDVILSDVMMPEKDGFEVCAILKKDVRTSHIPIVLLTAKVDVDSRLTGLGVGADAYLEKPFLKEELFIRLEKLVELRRNLQQHYAGISDYSNNQPEPVPVEAASLDELFLQKIRTQVEEHLNETDFSSIELARKLALSQSQLYRKLKALTGQSVAIHIRSIRLHNARELVKSSDMTIAEIAYSTGFSSPSYFTRTFFKEFEQLPTDLRK